MIDFFFDFDNSEKQGPNNAPHKISAKYTSWSGEKFDFIGFAFKLWWPSWILHQAEFCYPEALQCGQAACEILEQWVQWFQRKSHLNGL